MSHNNHHYDECPMCGMCNLFCECDKQPKPYNLVKNQPVVLASTSTGRVDCSKPNPSNLPKTFGKSSLTHKKISKRAGELKNLLIENNELIAAVMLGATFHHKLGMTPEELYLAWTHVNEAISQLQKIQRRFR